MALPGVSGIGQFASMNEEVTDLFRQLVKKMMEHVTSKPVDEILCVAEKIYHADQRNAFTGNIGLRRHIRKIFRKYCSATSLY